MPIIPLACGPLLLLEHVNHAHICSHIWIAPMPRQPPSYCSFDTMSYPTPLLSVTMSHSIVPMTPYLHAQGIASLCQDTSLHKTLHPYATIERGRLHHTLWQCNHGLHTTTCRGVHVWMLTKLVHLSCSCLKPCTKALRCGHTYATLHLLSL